MCEAVRVGFNNKILIDISCKQKPYYIDYDDYHYHGIINSTIPTTMYTLNPIIKTVDDYHFEKYHNNSKEYLVTEKRCTLGDKIYDKIYTGWKLFKPTKII
jgi:Golgi nucleoside diphosphatase